MHTMPHRDGDDSVRLSELIDQLHIICLSTRGRLRRLNRFWMGVDLVTALAPPARREAVQARLLEVARDCGLLDSPKSFIFQKTAGVELDAVSTSRPITSLLDSGEIS